MKRSTYSHDMQKHATHVVTMPFVHRFMHMRVVMDIRGVIIGMMYLVVRIVPKMIAWS